MEWYGEGLDSEPWNPSPDGKSWISYLSISRNWSLLLGWARDEKINAPWQLDFPSPSFTLGESGRETTSLLTRTQIECYSIGFRRNYSPDWFRYRLQAPEQKWNPNISTEILLFQVWILGAVRVGDKFRVTSITFLHSWTPMSNDGGIGVLIYSESSSR